MSGVLRKVLPLGIQLNNHTLNNHNHEHSKHHSRNNKRFNLR
jgi:hypothetical protein